MADRLPGPMDILTHPPIPTRAEVPVPKTRQPRTVGLNARESVFVREYLIDGNAKRSAIAAGYSSKADASRLLERPMIRSAVDDGRRYRARRLDISADRVLEEYARLAFADLRSLRHPDGTLKALSDLTEAEAAVIAGFDVTQRRVPDSDGDWAEETVTRIKTHDKLGALAFLGRYLGMDKGQGTGTGSGHTFLTTVQIDALDTSGLIDIVRALRQLAGGHVER